MVGKGKVEMEQWRVSNQRKQTKTSQKERGRGRNAEGKRQRKRETARSDTGRDRLKGIEGEMGQCRGGRGGTEREGGNC